MHTAFNRLGRFAALALSTLVVVALAPQAHAARETRWEVGRWLGFAHLNDQVVAGAPIVIDLALQEHATGGPTLKGTLKGIPHYEQRVFQVEGNVNVDGHIQLFLTSDGVTGGCDGSVRPILGFGNAEGHDDISWMAFEVHDTAHHVTTGKINLLHMYGLQEWAQVHARNLVGQGVGAFIGVGADVAGNTGLNVARQEGSSFYGGLNLVGYSEMQMVGTSNARGSIIYLCDGSVRIGDVNTLIGLLFTGGISPRLPEHPAVEIVGKYGMGRSELLLPAVQRIREAAMSTHY